MPAFYRGHNPQNDDLTSGDPNSQGTRDEAMGYLGDVRGDGYTIGAGNVNSGPTEDWAPNGEGYAIENGWKKGGTSAFDRDVERSRQMGAAGQQRPGVKLQDFDNGQIAQSRGLQMGSLGLLGNAARGGAPSRAAAMGQAGTENSIRQGMAAQAGARGPGAAVGAMGASQAAAADRMAQQNAAVTDLRAQEIGQAQKQYGAGTNATRGQDIAEAEANARFDAQQRALNEARQQGFEERAFGTRKTQLGAAQDYARNQSAAERERQRQTDAWNAREDNAFDQNTSWGLGAGMGGLSDERSKTKVNPMGSLSNLHRFMYRGG